MRAAQLITWMAQAHGMSDAVWERHANPLSGWLRIPVLPLLALAIWSRVWIGWWCLVPIALLLVYTWVNPRLFPAPRSTDTWMSKGVMGERVWLAADQIPVADHHLRAARVLNTLATFGLPVLIWGLWALNTWATVASVLWIVTFKLWFIDRMVWLFEDAARTHPKYRAWLR